MGAGLAVLALQTPGINHAARAVLVRMALVAHDRDDTPTYWAGWPALAIHGLGYEGYGPTAERAIARAIRDLLAAGLITIERPASPGKNVEYVLWIKPR